MLSKLEAIDLVRTTQLPIPTIRRRAVTESIRRATNEDEFLDIFLDVTSGSPYLSTQQKTQLANAILTRNMSVLRTTATSSPNNNSNSTSLQPHSAAAAEDPDVEFLHMARLIFTYSRKLQGLPVERRRQLIIGLHRARTENDIVSLVIEKLPNALSLNEAERQLVATDVLDHRYYRLLLPDRFDCVEAEPRLDSHEATTSTPTEDVIIECPICLINLGDSGTGSSELLPCCGKSFCHACLDEWATQSFECPFCRASLSRQIHL